MAEVRRYAKTVMGDSNTDKWSQFFYPAASICYAYRPSIKPGEVLAEKFKEHNWFCPTLGQCLRLYWYSKLAPADENIFTKAKNAGRFTDFAATDFWSSTEYSQMGAWFANFGSGPMGGNYKSSAYYCRPLAAF